MTEDLLCNFPFKNGSDKLGDSSKTTLKRFSSLERKFAQNEKFRKRYAESFVENLRLGIGKKFSNEELTSQNPEDIPEGRKVTLVTSANEKMSVVTKFSSFTELQRIMAYILRFIYNCSTKTDCLNIHYTSLN